MGEKGTGATVSAFDRGSKNVRYSKEQWATMFAALDEELNGLARRDAPEEDLWAAFEQLVQVPSSSIDRTDSRWWWEQVYAAMERHGLTELSRQASAAG